MNAFRSVVFLMLVAAMGLPACGRASEKMPIDIHRAIEIAEGALASRNVDRANLELVSAKQYASPINDIVPRKPASDYQRALGKKLYGRRYWYVYYILPSAEMGGDVAVFIDARTGEVIEVYRGR